MIPPTSNHTFTTADIIEALDVLWRKLDDDGIYVGANTVELAKGEINRLEELVKFYRNAFPTEAELSQRSEYTLSRIKTEYTDSSIIPTCRRCGEEGHKWQRCSE